MKDVKGADNVGVEHVPGKIPGGFQSSAAFSRLTFWWVDLFPFQKGLYNAIEIAYEKSIESMLWHCDSQNTGNSSNPLLSLSAS